MKKTILYLIAFILIISYTHAQATVIDDYISWYNFSHFVNTDDWEDLGTNGLDIDDGVSELVNNSLCVNGQCMHYNTTGTASVQYLFGNPISDNWTMALQVSANQTSPDGFLHLFGGDNPNIGTDSDSSGFRCSMEQTNGTQYPSVTIEDPYSVNTNYVLMCYKNGTQLCGQINNNTPTCTTLNGVQKNNQFFTFGRTGKDQRGYYSSGAVAYNRTLSEDERNEVYQCLSSRGDLNVGNCTAPLTIYQPDVYVKSIKYPTLYNFSTQNNTIAFGTYQINLTIASAENATPNFDYNFTLEDTNLCSGTINLTANGEITIPCSWTINNYGIYEGKIFLDINNDVNESDEVNNVDVIFPVYNRPYLSFNLTEWTTDLKPYCDDSNNYIAYDSCNWYKTFLSEGFDDANIGNTVDPRGKKGRENAMGCLYNNYGGWNGTNWLMNTSQCIYAVDHIYGWLNRTVTTYSDVQNIHELIHVAYIYDILFPTFTPEEHAMFSQQGVNICTQITNLSNTRPENDNDNAISGGNGKGFGSGMGFFCQSMLGEYNQNPNLLKPYVGKNYGNNMAKDWNDRLFQYLYAGKNDSYTTYQEGIYYKFYSQYHLVELLPYYFRYNIGDFSQFENYFCAMGREIAVSLLDYTYSGNDLIGGSNIKTNWISKGDANSYSYIGSDVDGPVGYGALSFYASMCSDQNVKDALLWVKQSMYNNSVFTRSLTDMYIYKQHVNGATPNPPDNILDKVQFDNANDIFIIRPTYNYVNDTVIVIDGGEERGSGHSTAQGYFLYALGLNFIDYTQTPMNDDIRDEAWHNTISLQNTSVTSEDEGGSYSQTCGNAPLNQYYGMLDCSLGTTSDYPDFRDFPLTYGGDVEDYMGSNDGSIFGSFVWRPYLNADPVREYFIGVDDVILKRSVVSGSTESGIYHNFINVNDTMTMTKTGNAFTLTGVNVSNANLLTNLTYSSNNSITLLGGETNVSLCFSKTDCSGSNKGNSNYRRMYYYVADQDLDMIFYHHWYNTGGQKAITTISGTDEGVAIDTNKKILFDTSGDNSISNNNVTIKGWGAIIDQTQGIYGAFNSTNISEGVYTLLLSNDTIEAYMDYDSDKITFHVNTMQRSVGIDIPASVRVTINTLVWDGNFTISKDNSSSVNIVSNSSTSLTFDVQGGQVPTYYLIQGAYVNGSGGGDPTPDPTPSNITITTTSFCTPLGNTMANVSSYADSIGNILGVGLLVMFTVIAVFGFAKEIMPDTQFSTPSIDMTTSQVTISQIITGVVIAVSVIIFLAAGAISLVSILSC